MSDASPVVSPDMAYQCAYRARDLITASVVDRSLQTIATLATQANQGDSAAVQELYMVLFGDWPLHVMQGMRFSTRAEADCSQLKTDLASELHHAFLKHGWSTLVEVGRALPPHDNEWTLVVRINHTESVPSVD